VTNKPSCVCGKEPKLTERHGWRMHVIWFECECGRRSESMSYSLMWENDIEFYRQDALDKLTMEWNKNVESDVALSAQREPHVQNER